MILFINNNTIIDNIRLYTTYMVSMKYEYNMIFLNMKHTIEYKLISKL